MLTRASALPKIRKRLREAGWPIHCGPCDETGKRASAGVGVMCREDEVKVYPEKIKDGELYKAYECAMVAKYTMDVGWERSYTVYNLYGKSGGSKEAITTTEALCQGCRREGEQGIHGPKMWVGGNSMLPHANLER